MALRPPQHRADALGRYIHPLDDAWDDDRAFGAAFGDDHPVARYLAGKTRYDLAAGDIRSFLRPGATPTIFSFRRLTLAEYTTICDMGGVHAMYTACAKLALVDVDGEKMTVEQLYEMRPALPHEIGMAVWRYNQPPDDAEGKRSGSGGGDSSPTGPAPSDGSR